MCVSSYDIYYLEWIGLTLLSLEIGLGAFLLHVHAISCFLSPASIDLELFHIIIAVCVLHMCISPGLYVMYITVQVDSPNAMGPKLVLLFPMAIE